jgi:DNA-binding transcriptional regulator GbsR (MarR family)
MDPEILPSFHFELKTPPLRSNTNFVKTSSLRKGTASRAKTLTLLPLQLEMAEIFSDLAELFGNPASLGSIYGLLFASPGSLSMEQIVGLLDISNGTASQGLRRLVELQAISPRRHQGERTTRYTAKLELRPFVSMFLESQLLPRLGHSEERIGSLEATLIDLPQMDREILETRLHRALKWHRRAKVVLPLIRRILKG